MNKEVLDKRINAMVSYGVFKKEDIKNIYITENGKTAYVQLKNNEWYSLAMHQVNPNDSMSVIMEWS